MDLSVVEHLTKTRTFTDLLREAARMRLPQGTRRLYYNGHFCAIGAAYYVATKRFPEDIVEVYEWANNMMSGRFNTDIVWQLNDWCLRGGPQLSFNEIADRIDAGFPEGLPEGFPK